MARLNSVIQQVRLEVHTADGQQGRALSERLSRLFHDDLLAVLTEELARHSPTSPEQELTRLVLNLAPVTASRLEQDLPGRLRTALRQALAELGPPAAGREAKRASAPAPLHILRHFLLHGQLPWQASSPNFQLDAVVAQAMRQQPGDLRDLLREVGPQLLVRQRLARQLALPTLLQLVFILEPGHAPVVQAYLLETLAAHRCRPLVPATVTALHQVVYELVLADLLAHWHTQFNRRAFIERQLRQLAAHYNLNFEILLHQLVAALPPAGPAGVLTPTLPGLLHALYHQAQVPSRLPTNTATPTANRLNATAGLLGANPVAGLPAEAYSALVYYLRHGSLPAAWGGQFGPAALGAGLEAVLCQGRVALQQLTQAAGGPATAQALVRHLPPARLQTLAQMLVPGQARPLLALLTELTTLAKPAGPTEQAAYREHLWQRAVAWLLAEPTTPVAAIPHLRQWLPQQVALPRPTDTAATSSARDQLLDYLLLGWAATPQAGQLSPAQLRRALQTLVAQDAPQLIRFLRQHLTSRQVLRHLAALTDAATLVQLLPGRRRPSRASGQLAVLAALFGSPGPAPGAARRQLVREAYLHFHFLVRDGAVESGLSVARQLLAAYHLPAQALWAHLRRQRQQLPALAGSAFFNWLTGALAKLTGKQLVESEFYLAVPSRQRASASVIPTPFASTLLANATGSINWPAGPGGWLRTPPAGRLGPAATYHLAGSLTLGMAEEAIFRYLLGKTSARPAELPALLRWVVARQPAALLAFLRRYATMDRLWPRLAVLANFAALGRLLAAGSRARQPRPTLAALDELTSGGGGNTRLLVFLKTAYLLTHFRPAASWSATSLWQLAAACELPRRATLTRLKQLAQRYPVLAATRLFRQLASRPDELTGTMLPATALAGHTNGLEPPAALPIAEAALADQNLLYHYLLHGQAPWWHPTPVAPVALSQTLHRVAQQPRPLQEFLRQHAHQVTVQQQLAQLANFSLLHELLPSPGLGRRRPLVRSSLAALDRRLRSATGQLGRFRQFLRAAYIAFKVVAVGPANPLAAVRHRAAAAGWSWRGVLAQVRELLHLHPALAADPFFGVLLQATLRQLGGPRLRPTVAARLQLATPLPAAEAAWHAVEAYLQAGATGLAPAATQGLATLLFPAHVAQLARLRPYLTLATGQQRLLQLLPGEQLPGLLRQLWPAAYHQLSGIVRDWQRLLARGIVRTGRAPASLWPLALAVAAATGPAARPVALVQRLLQAESAGQPLAATAWQVLRNSTRQRLALGGVLIAELAAQLPALAAPKPPLPASSDGLAKPKGPATLRSKPQPTAPEPTGTSYLDNAGLVLLWPFFTILFDRLGYLEQRQFKTSELADQATYLLQYLVTGTEDFAEHRLVLNKLLCGVEQTHPLPRPEVLTSEEKTTAEGLLGAAISQWTVLKNTSIAGLRETFLQRPGKLDWQPDRVTLTVETKTVDILLDQRPWSIALIKLPWMALPLYVTWR